jgi:hypothetical protein
VLVLEDVLSDHTVQVHLHELEHKVNVFIIICPNHVYQLYDVLMVKLLEEDDFAVGALSICSVLKGVKDLLQSECLVCLSITDLPDMAIGPTTNLSNDFIAAQDVYLYLLGHVIILILFLLVCAALSTAAMM